ncbi:MAG TPA: hypothetical protein VFN13_09110 [Rudaea sp.]|nr:hypothetical protein [Rudaea sp.]
MRIAAAGYDETHVDSAFAAFSRARNAVDCFADVVPELERLAWRYTLIRLSNGSRSAAYWSGTIFRPFRQRA